MDQANLRHDVLLIYQAGHLMDLLSYSGVFLHLRQTTLFAPYLPLHGRVEDEISVKLDEFLKLKGRKQEIRN